ncbi:hypothetical protein CPB85DRAFT_1310371 [Mucidula mucida]|nr:hypothetical protein CPB85DRAFT_1310371 [Mucidula mucida]
MLSFPLFNFFIHPCETSLSQCIGMEVVWRRACFLSWNARQSFFDVQLCGMAGLGRGPCALPRVRTVGPGNVAENRP